MKDVFIIDFRDRERGTGRRVGGKQRNINVNETSVAIFYVFLYYPGN